MERGPAPSAVRLSLLGGFSLTVGDEPLSVPPSSERVLAFVALSCNGAVPRALVAGTLWPDTPEHCAFANLRSALSRLQHSGRAALDVTNTTVRLARDVGVDFHRARSLAHLVLDGRTAVADAGLGATTVLALSADLLPGWYEDWVLLEADSWRDLRTHALERLSAEFLAARRFAEAVTAAHAAVRAAPLRASSQASLIRAHLAEGNTSDAAQSFERYERRLRAETGLRPAPGLRRLVRESPGSRSR
ncbi:hypothetical protein GCM10010218_60610 [Streptomyces mashuensis]|uniref:Bacterial transcriptional activator domain-containing protein n=1 Tax=Streptomyces mashuensis TaxID=33904 RepID=A0A919BAE7_9ACTN|nr:BTAD domain-containing putative transcriptional regulator [Streptomyces mashuensis]GHF71149.1 hypothetical protein GCM10010218_60610 [Streptomyces mashuensis]